MPQIRPLAPAERTWFLAVNNAAVPHVNSLAAADLDALLGAAAFVRVAAFEGRPAAGMIAFAPGADYHSENYRWFAARYADFLYVDRIVVEPRARGQGLGRALYDGVLAAARDHAGRVACEVNERPPNPGSFAFHQRLGFRHVESVDRDGGAKRVAMLLRES